jgi:predicted RNA-binding Zn-ribbon protein involved in translation (DUF1610 family)
VSVVKCPSCSVTLRLIDDDRKRFACPKCGAEITLPASSARRNQSQAHPFSLDDDLPSISRPNYALGLLVAAILVCGIALVFVMRGCSGINKPTKIQEDHRSEPSEPEPSTSAKRPSASTPKPSELEAGPLYTIGDISIGVKRAIIGNVPLTKFRERGESEHELAAIYISVKNESSTKKIQFERWQGESFTTSASLRDDLGNKYKQISFGILTNLSELEIHDRASIYPGKTIEDILVFEQPIDAAKKLTLTLQGKNLEAKSDFTFSIPMSFTEKR